MSPCSQASAIRFHASTHSRSASSSLRPRPPRWTVSSGGCGCCIASPYLTCAAPSPRVPVRMTSPAAAPSEVEKPSGPRRRKPYA